MNDPVYEEKYRDGASKGDLLGKSKQAIDARHLDGRSGFLVQTGFHSDPDLLAVGAGLFTYPEPWTSMHASVTGVTDSSDPDSYLGLDLGLRLQTPTRVAPFVGVGTFNGVSRGVKDATNDGLDNDDDMFIDEPGEETSTFDQWLSTAYPEMGVHFWLTPRVRLTTSGRYQFSSRGRDHDSWLFGISLSFLPVDFGSSDPKFD